MAEERSSASPTVQSVIVNLVGTDIKFMVVTEDGLRDVTDQVPTAFKDWMLEHQPREIGFPPVRDGP